MITAIFTLPDNKPLELQLSRTTPTSTIKSLLQEKTGLAASSLKLEIANASSSIILSDDAELADYETHIQSGKISIKVSSAGSGLTMKQIYWFGYGSPIVIFLLAYFLYPHKNSFYYDLITFCAVFHFVKRILEGHFVHILSTDKFPVPWALGMIVYYGGLFGVLVSLEVFIWRPSIQLWSNGVWIVFLAGFLLSEFFNFYCHYKLRGLRVKSVNGVTKKVSGRKVPFGLFFDSVISPNYSFELLIWLSFAILFKSYAGFLFFVLSIIVLIPRTKENKDKMLKIATEISPEVKASVEKRYLMFPYII
jgi:hypothetical protein